MKSQLPSLDIVIVHWNSPEFLKDCLKSVCSSAKNRFQITKIWVVDNASSNKSFSEILTLDLPIEIIENPVNVGFAKANNQVGLKTESDYLFLMNPDVQLQADALDRLVEFAEKPDNEKVGILGPSMKLGNGEVLKECAVFPNAWNLINDFLGLYRISPKWFPSFRLGNWDHHTTKRVDHVMGGACFVRTSIFKLLGGLDERYFLYFVDLDFSKRMSMLGYSSVYLKEAEVIHRTDEIKDSGSAFRYLHSIKGRFLYATTHMGVGALFLITILSIGVEPVLRFGRAFFQLDAKQIQRVFETYKLLLIGVQNEDSRVSKV